jgi:xanthine permease XanP
LFAFLPKLGTLIAVMPSPVLGGTCVAVFGMIFPSGLSVLSYSALTERNSLIIEYPFYVAALASSIPGTGITAFLLNLILPNEGEDEVVQDEIIKSIDEDSTAKEMDGIG